MVQINNLGSYKMLVHSSELQNSYVAVHRSDIADFLCLSFWNGLGVNFLISIKNIGTVWCTRKAHRLYYVSVLKHRSIFSNFKLNHVAQ